MHHMAVILGTSGAGLAYIFIFIRPLLGEETSLPWQCCCLSIHSLARLPLPFLTLQIGSSIAGRELQYDLRISRGVDQAGLNVRQLPPAAPPAALGRLHSSSCATCPPVCEAPAGQHKGAES